jgi:hypothetical protein
MVIEKIRAAWEVLQAFYVLPTKEESYPMRIILYNKEFWKDAFDKKNEWKRRNGRKCPPPNTYLSESRRMTPPHSE